MATENVNQTEGVTPEDNGARFFHYGDADAITMTATKAALRGAGIPVDKQPCGDGYTVVGADGHDWHITATDEIFWHAGRPRTEAERVAYIDILNSRFSYGWFSSDKQDVVCNIAVEMMAIAEQLAKRPRRGGIRKMRKRLLALGAAQWQLTRKSNVNMASVRADLAAVGLEVPQRPLYD